MQVSELQQGVTVINHSTANSIVSARLSSGLGSKLPSPPPRCCWIGLHEWAKGPRATLSVQGVRTGGGVKDGRNYHEAVGGVHCVKHGREGCQLAGFHPQAVPCFARRNHSQV